MNQTGFLDFFLPEGLRARDPELARQGRLTVVISLATAPASTLFALQHLFVYGAPAAAAVLFVAALVAAGVPFLQRKTASPGAAANVLGIGFYLAIGAVSFLRGGFVTAVLLWELLLPLAAVLLHQRRYTYAWGGAVLAQFAALALLERLGFAATPKVTGNDVVGLSLALLAVVAITVFYDRGRERLEDRKRELERQIVVHERLEGLGRLAGGIAHDFNNLLTVIQTYSATALDELDERPPTRGDLEAIQDAAVRGSDLTRQLLAFGRRDVVNVEVVDPNALVTSIDTLLERLLPETIELERRLESTQGHIKADRRQMEQVLINLAVNARDAMPDGGRLVVGARDLDLTDPADAERHELAAGKYVELVVSDDGQGIEPDVTPHIFEPFFTTKEDGEGTGLGLATAYGAVRRAGGDIRVESKLGEGSTFRVLLPAVDPEPSSASLRAGRRLRGKGEPMTVLVAEDERDVSSAVCRVLRRRGHQLLVAEDGKRALELSGEHEGPIDVLLTDVVMPRMSGFELAKTLRAARPKLRVVYMSGYADDPQVARDVEQHQAGFIRKPFSNNDLLRQIERGSRRAPPSAEANSG